MDKIVFSLVLILILTSCRNNEIQKPEPLNSEMAKVKLVIDDFGRFWETEDMELLSKIMAHDDDMINFGSEASEVFVGWEQLKNSVEHMLPILNETKINVRDQRIKLNVSGDVAWFSEIWDWDLLFEGQRVQIPNQRLTGVLELREGNWVIVQFHNSVPVAE